MSVLKQPCIFRINPHSSGCIILFIYWWIFFIIFCLEFLNLYSEVKLPYKFLSPNVLIQFLLLFVFVKYINLTATEWFRFSFYSFVSCVFQRIYHFLPNFQIYWHSCLHPLIVLMSAGPLFYSLDDICACFLSQLSCQRFIVFISIFKNLFILSIYFWLYWVLVAMCGLSLVAASRGYSSLWCTGFSLRWLLLLWSMGSRHAGFSSCGERASVVAAHGLQ